MIFYECTAKDNSKSNELIKRQLYWNCEAIQKLMFFFDNLISYAFTHFRASAAFHNYVYLLMSRPCLIYIYISYICAMIRRKCNFIREVQLNYVVVGSQQAHEAMIL